MKVLINCSKFLKSRNIIRNIFYKNASNEQPKCVKSVLHKGPPWKILFFGTDDFALHSLKALCAKLRTGTLIDSLGIVTKNGSIVEKFGRDECLPSYIWPIKPADINNKYDIGMVVSFGKMIPNEILNSFPLGCINAHASILPRWRGAAPVIHAIMNGDTETGISIMRIHPHTFDVGEIVRQYRIPIESDEFTLQLEARLAKCGSLLLMECLRDLPKCLEMAVPQFHTDITYAPKVKSEMAIVYWNKMPARKIYNLHRALNHLYPLTTKWFGKIVKFTEILLDERHVKKIIHKTGSCENYKSALDFLNTTNVYNASDSHKLLDFNENDGGSVLFMKNKKELNIKCCDGNYITVKRLKISGKSISAVDFYNGFLIKCPKKLWRFGS